MPANENRPGDRFALSGIDPKAQPAQDVAQGSVGHRAPSSGIPNSVGFLLSITLIRESSKRAMKEIPISTTLATEWLSRNRLQAHQ
jgi:hypothetical protein